MKRRDFLTASCVAGLAPAAGLALAKSADGKKKDILELRHYTCASADKQKALEEFFAAAAVPAMNRAGIGPVGVFKPAEGDEAGLWVLLVHESLDSVVAATARLMADEAFLQSGKTVLDAALKDPAYTRIDSSLLLSFDGVPKVEIPTAKDSRVLQLRIYESHNQKKALKKIEMFNTGGELEIFRRVGMPPVFFGQALVGPGLPNLTYMLAFDDMDALKRGWSAFLKDPAWEKLKKDPQYADTVSNITNIVLRPAAGSQV